MRRVFLLILSLGLLAACTRHDRLQRHLARADTAYNTGDMKVARLEYLNVARLDPHNAVALSRLGLIYADAGETPRAFQFLSRARELDPANLSVRSKLSLILAAVGQFSNALAEAEFVLKERPGDTDALLALADSVTSKTQIQAALSRLSAVLPQEQNKPAFQLALGQLQLKTQDLAAAEASFNRAAQMDPEDPRAPLGLAQSYWLQSRNAEANLAFQKAVELAPVRSLNRLRYAEFLTKSGNPDAAKALLQQSVEQAPDFLPPLVVLAELALQENDQEGCAGYLEQILKREPNHREGLLIRARLRLLQAENSLALADLEKLTTLNPRDPVPFYHLGLAYKAARDSVKALAALNRAVLLNQEFSEAILLRSELLISRGDVQLAIPSLVRLCEKAPRLSSAHYLLASAYRLRGSPEDALAVYENLAKTFPEDPQPLYLSGVTFREQHNLDQARKFFHKALEVEPNYVLAVDQIIELDIQKGDYSAGLAMVQTYIERFPTKPMPYQLQAKIHQARGDIEQSEAALLKAVQCDPDFFLAHRALAQLYILSNRHAEAISRLEAVLARNDRDPGSLLQLGMLYEAEKRFLEARATYEKLLQINPQSVPAMNNLAYLLAEKFNEIPAALSLAQRARDAAPFEPHSADTFGWIAFKQGDYSRALAVIHKAAEKLSSQPEVIYHLGMAYYMNGAEDQARSALEFALQSQEEFNGKDQAQLAFQVLGVVPERSTPADRALLEEALKDNQNDLMAHIRLAQLAECEQRWDAALHHYEAARHINPMAHRVLIKLAAIHIEVKNSPDEGLEFARRAWSLNQHPENAAELGRLAVLAGEYLWASPILEEAVRHNPSWKEPAYHLALSFFSLARFSVAESIFQDLLKANDAFPQRTQAELLLSLSRCQIGQSSDFPLEAAASIQDKDFVPAQFAKGLLKEQQGNYTAAREIYEQIAQTAPRFLPAQRQMAILLVDHTDDDAVASELLRKLSLQIPDDVQIKKLSGKLAFRQQDYRLALGFLLDAAVDLPRDPDVLYHLGLTQFHLNDFGAKKTLALALALEASSPLSSIAREALIQMQ